MVLNVQVRYEMARALCVPVTEHTHGDLMLSVNAQRLFLVNGHTVLYPEHNAASGLWFFSFPFSPYHFELLP